LPQSNPDKEMTRKRLETFVHETRASETVARAITQSSNFYFKQGPGKARAVTETRVISALDSSHLFFLKNKKNKEQVI
jgi:hypothetical protein